VVTLSKAEELLQTSYSKYRHQDGSEISRAPVWSLPVHLHEHIDVVQPTTSFMRSKPEFKSPVGRGPSYPVSWWEQEGKKLYGGQSVNGTHAQQIAAACSKCRTTNIC
jgi:tripeptidyl-peptidase I